MNTRVLVVSLTILAVGAMAATAEANPSGAAAPARQTNVQGKVGEVINAAGYTYLQIDTGSEKVWAAAPEFAVKEGDRAEIAGAMPMRNYHSKTLNRTFDLVYFAAGVTVNGNSAPAPANSAASGLPKGHPTTAGTRDAPSIDLANIARAPNGQTVAEVYKAAASLAGKKVTVRGRVVKYNGGIMGRNWLHIRDGSGAEGTNNLTVTSKDTARVGDLVVIQGVLATNRNFGGGYKYPLIVEEASVAVEAK
jgi:uncharacterized protein YdbL (DUF1318 family)